MNGSLSKIFIIILLGITLKIEETQAAPYTTTTTVITPTDITPSLNRLKEYSRKYKIAENERDQFFTDANYLSGSEIFPNLTSAQANTLKEAINLALYGMVFETSFGTNSDGWSSFQSNFLKSSTTEANTKPDNDNFNKWMNFLTLEIGQYESNTARDASSLLADGKLTPILGDEGLISKLTNLVSRRMEAGLDVLKTKAGSTIQATTPTTVTRDHIQLKVAQNKYVLQALEDPTQSWGNLKALINRAMRIIATMKIANSENLVMALSQLMVNLDKPITVDERILALKHLVDTVAISDKAGDDQEFEIRLIKIIDSLSSAATNDQKTVIVDLINKFSIIGKKDKTLFNDYIRILTQGRHPKEIFKDDQKIALLWNEMDGSEPKQKYCMKDDVDPSKVTLKYNDLLDKRAQFKIKVTQNAEVVIYIEETTSNSILNNQGSLATGDINSPTDDQKFYVYGSPAALSFKSIKSDFGFLTVSFDKKLSCQINGKAAGKTNSDGTLEPGSWGIFKIVEVGQLHERLSTIRDSWPTDWTTKNDALITKVTKILDQYAEQNVFMANNDLMNDENAVLFLTEIINFFQKGFRSSPEQWDWFLSSDLNKKANDLVGKIDTAMTKLTSGGGQTKQTLQSLKDQLTIPPQATLEPHENAPKNGSVVTLFIVDNYNKEKFMRVVQETDARGTHYFLKADLDDPIDPQCHLNVIAQSNLLAFSFTAPDKTVKTLQFVPRAESELTRLWQDEIGKNNIKIMSRLELKDSGRGDLNSKDRYNEQFQMDYTNPTKKDLVYNFDCLAPGAGILMIDDDGYATTLKVNFKDNKITPTFKADPRTGIKILPVSGFLTELGALRSESDPIKVVDGYTSKIDIAETNQDLEFLIMEFENFIEKTQLNRALWMKTLLQKDFSDSMAKFLEKITPKVPTNKTDANTSFITAFGNMKATFVQSKLALNDKVIAIKWTAPDGKEWYLKNDSTGAAFIAEDYADASCQFALSYNEPTDPIKFGLKIKQTL